MLNKNSLNFLSESSQKKYLESTTYYSEQQLFYILDLLTNAISLNKNTFKKIHLETLILKIIKSKNIIPVDILVKRLIELEKNLNIAPQASPSQRPSQEKPSINQSSPTSISVNESLKNETQDLTQENKHQYEKVNFSLSKSKDVKVINTKEQSHYDTLLKFTQVELDAINKN
ncbi:hypothetical protein LCGC14_2259870 [marine sediment metagenome]|uniref:Uncharacterized protein n=1 Tax=marine sediment metagenome TaxID=412755 RepID=A0A0F9D007_9ZZZZ